MTNELPPLPLLCHALSAPSAFTPEALLEAVRVERNLARDPCLLFIGQGNRRRGDKHQRKKAKTHFPGFYSIIHLWAVHPALVLKRGGTL